MTKRKISNRLPKRYKEALQPALFCQWLMANQSKAWNVEDLLKDFPQRSYCPLEEYLMDTARAPSLMQIAQTGHETVLVHWRNGEGKSKTPWRMPAWTNKFLDMLHSKDEGSLSAAHVTGVAIAAWAKSGELEPPDFLSKLAA